MSVVDRILRLPEIAAAPPVLVDVGAAKGIHPKWRQIAKYSVCVAFEADERELQSATAEGAGFLRLTTYNRIAAEHSSRSERFLSRRTIRRARPPRRDSSNVWISNTPPRASDLYLHSQAR